MLRARIGTALLALPILLYLIFLGPLWAFQAVVLGFTALALAEYFRMAFPDDHRAQGGGIVLGFLVAASIGLFPETRFQLFALSLVAVLVIALLRTLLEPENPARSLASTGTMIVGILYAGSLLPHLVPLRLEPGGFGAAWVLYILAVGMGGDTAGYFAGRFLGRRPLAPRISPKKTVEGALGAVGGNLLAGSAVKALFLPGAGWVEILVLSVAAGALAQLGDLCESLLKRAFGAKDSGHLLPGHGGVLDRTDSLVFPTVLVYYYLTVTRGTF